VAVGPFLDAKGKLSIAKSNRKSGSAELNSAVGARLRRP
jgi:hypothetical protein